MHLNIENSAVENHTGTNLMFRGESQAVGIASPNFVRSDSDDFNSSVGLPTYLSKRLMGPTQCSLRCANNESSEFCGIIKLGRRVKFNGHRH